MFPNLLSSLISHLPMLLDCLLSLTYFQASVAAFQLSLQAYDDARPFSLNTISTSSGAISSRSILPYGFQNRYDPGRGEIPDKLR